MQVIELQNILKSWKGPPGITKSNSWLHIEAPKKKKDSVCESAVQMLFELLKLGAVPTVLLHAHHSLVKKLPLTPSSPSPTQLHAVPSGPVAVTESRAQRCTSAPCEELQLP